MDIIKMKHDKFWQDLEELDEILVDYAEALAFMNEFINMKPQEAADLMHKEMLYAKETGMRIGYAVGLFDIFYGLIDRETVMESILKAFKKGYELDGISDEGRQDSNPKYVDGRERSQEDVGSPEEQGQTSDGSTYIGGEDEISASFTGGV